MKNMNAKHQETILGFIKKNPNATVELIKEGCPKISDVLVRKVLKDLLADNVITANQDDGTYTYKSGKKNGVPVVQVAEGKEDKAIKVDKKKIEEEELGPPTPSGRDNSKYDFNNLKALSKGRIALAVIQAHVKANPKISLTKLQEVFESKNIQPRYGVVEEISKARKFTKNKRDRYFIDANSTIKLGAINAVVTNQWGLDSITEFLKVAKGLGYKIQVSK